MARPRDHTQRGHVLARSYLKKAEFGSGTLINTMWKWYHMNTQKRRRRNNLQCFQSEESWFYHPIKICSHWTAPLSQWLQRNQYHWTVIAFKYMRNLFTRSSESNGRVLRSTDTDLKLPLLKTSAGQKSFSYRGARLWNSLSREAKVATSLSAFKRLSKNDVDALSQS